jgi:prepilin-type N-terminal cleavage/methylation domain-containing protein
MIYKETCCFNKNLNKAFTLVELIIVVIIVGILASLGLTQYNLVVEKSRLAEAKVRIGTMRQLAYGYYADGGVMSAMQNADLGVGEGCTSNSYYNYWISPSTSYVQLVADRCASGGKSPNTSRAYRFKLVYYPATGSTTWYCRYIDDNSPCFGFPPTN